MKRKNIIKKIFNSKLKPKRVAKNSMELVCFWLILATYVFSPLYTIYKSNSNNRAGK